MIGILLINLGTPEAPTENAVRDYLRIFLMDPYVITLPTLLRKLLVEKLILPKRPKQSAHAYNQIWTDKGSPLLVHSLELQTGLQNKLGDNYSVALGMRYSKPSIENALEKLQQQNCEKIIVLPLYPQFANATTQSSIDVVNTSVKKLNIHADIKIIDDFYREDFYIQSIANIMRAVNSSGFILFSYHGLPTRQKGSEVYRQQCFATTKLIAGALNLSVEKYETAFQSRLGFTKWIAPYTDQIIKNLREKGIKQLSVVCPSFVADCIETLEEINMRLRDEWIALGGETFELIPCLNADDYWINALSQWLKQATIA